MVARAALSVWTAGMSAASAGGNRQTRRTHAAAKLNLTLEVIGKRSDGFHDLASVAVSLDLADEVMLLRTDEGRRVSYRDDAGRPMSIATKDDIILRAWSALATHCELPGGAHVVVTKRIPVASGLGGGSSDAAAFLRLARLAWALPLTDDALSTIGAEVGSDVPACLLGGAVRMSGRGEIVRPAPATAEWNAGWSILLHRPEIPVPAAKTASMYRSLRSADFRAGAATDMLLASMARGAPLQQGDCVNSFDRSAHEVMPGLTLAGRRMGAAISHATQGFGIEPVTPLLAGAGPALFAVLPQAVAESAAERLRNMYGRSGFTGVARALARSEATAVHTL